MIERAVQHLVLIPTEEEEKETEKVLNIAKGLEEESFNVTKGFGGVLQKPDDNQGSSESPSHIDDQQQKRGTKRKQAMIGSTALLTILFWIGLILTVTSATKITPFEKGGVIFTHLGSAYFKETELKMKFWTDVSPTVNNQEHLRATQRWPSFRS